MCKLHGENPDPQTLSDLEQQFPNRPSHCTRRKVKPGIDACGCEWCQRVNSYWEEHHLFPTRAVRGTDADYARYDLLSPIAIRRYAEAMAEGAEKYSSYNWEKGIPVNDLINHALRHIFLYLGGDRSEDHLGHTLWNIAADCHSDELWPELNKDHLRQEGCKPPIEILKRQAPDHWEEDTDHNKPPSKEEPEITSKQIVSESTLETIDHPYWEVRHRSDHHTGWEVYSDNTNTTWRYNNHFFEKVNAQKMADGLNEDPIVPTADHFHKV